MPWKRIGMGGPYFNNLEMTYIFQCPGYAYIISGIYTATKHVEYIGIY